MLNCRETQRKKCPYSELFWSPFSRIRTEYGEILRISPYSVRMRENADQNHSEYGRFSRSESKPKSSSICSSKPLLTCWRIQICYIVQGYFTDVFFEKKVFSEQLFKNHLRMDSTKMDYSKSKWVILNHGNLK